MPIGEPHGWMTFLQFTKDDIMRGVELPVMVLLGLIVLLLVVRPLVRRIIAPEAGRAARRPAAIAGPPSAERDVPAAAASASRRITADGTSDGRRRQPAIPPKMIDIAQVQGQVHAQSVQKVGELADKNPNETVAIIRSWLHESAA